MHDVNIYVGRGFVPKNSKKKMQMNTHHRLPLSLGGNNDWRNIVKVNKKKHELGHKLFGVESPCSIIEWLNENWFPMTHQGTIIDKNCQECPYANKCRMK